MRRLVKSLLKASTKMKSCAKKTRTPPRPPPQIPSNLCTLEAWKSCHCSGSHLKNLGLGGIQIQAGRWSLFRGGHYANSKIRMLTILYKHNLDYISWPNLTRHANQIDTLTTPQCIIWYPPLPSQALGLGLKTQ